MGGMKYLGPFEPYSGWLLLKDGKQHYAVNKHSRSVVRESKIGYLHTVQDGRNLPPGEHVWTNEPDEDTRKRVIAAAWPMIDE